MSPIERQHIRLWGANMSVTGRQASRIAGRWVGVGLVLALLASVVSVVGARPAAAACANTIACENTLPGDPPSDWQVNGTGTRRSRASPRR